jgi:hypothetical protein
VDSPLGAVVDGRQIGVPLLGRFLVQLRGLFDVIDPSEVVVPEELFGSLECVPDLPAIGVDRRWFGVASDQTGRLLGVRMVGVPVPEGLCLISDLSSRLLTVAEQCRLLTVVEVVIPRVPTPDVVSVADLRIQVDEVLLSLHVDPQLPVG